MSNAQTEQRRINALPPIDVRNNAEHIASCLREGGFARLVLLGGAAVMVYPSVPPSRAVQSRPEPALNVQTSSERKEQLRRRRKHARAVREPWVFA